MALRRLAPLCLTLLAPSLGFAAPVQRPGESVSPETQSAAQEQAPEAPEADVAAPDEALVEQPENQADPPADGAKAPQTETETETGTGTETETETEASEDLSELLVSDEPPAPAPRVRVASDREQVDHSERMRNYYAKTYRPAHNPPRVYFAARAAFAMAGTNDSSGGGRLAFANVEAGQTWNFISYGLGASLYGGNLTFGEEASKYGGLLIGAGPSVGLGRLGLFGRGYLDLRVGYNFFYAPIFATRPELVDPPNAAPHGPKIQVDLGLLLHDSESRRFRHGLGASLGWQMLVHTFTGEYPRANAFNVGLSYFFG